MQSSLLNVVKHVPLADDKRALGSAANSFIVGDMSAVTLDELLTLEHAGWQSLCDSSGGSFYGGLMTEDGLFILVNGMVMTKDEVARSLDGAPAWDAYEITDARLIDLGEEVAVLVYRATSTRPDLVGQFEALMASTYRRIDGNLRLACYQQTTITH